MRNAGQKASPTWRERKENSAIGRQGIFGQNEGVGKLTKETGLGDSADVPRVSKGSVWWFQEKVQGGLKKIN